MLLNIGIVHRWKPFLPQNRAWKGAGHLLTQLAALALVLNIFCLYSLFFYRVDRKLLAFRDGTLVPSLCSFSLEHELRPQKPNPKKNMPKLIITSPYVHSRVDIQHIYHGHWQPYANSRPKPYSRVDFVPQLYRLYRLWIWPQQN